MGSGEYKMKAVLDRDGDRNMIRSGLSVELKKEH